MRAAAEGVGRPEHVRGTFWEMRQLQMAIYNPAAAIRGRVSWYLHGRLLIDEMRGWADDVWRLRRWGTTVPGRDLAALLNEALGRDLPQRFAVTGRVAFAPAVMRAGDRTAAVHPHGSEFRLEFGWKGAGQARGVTPDAVSAAGAAALWIRGSGLEELAARYPFVEFSAIALARERGDPVEHQWRTMLESVEGDPEGFHDLITAASENAVLRGCFPYLGHRFALAEDAFTHDVLVTAFLIRPGWYASNRLAEGWGFEWDANAAVAYMVDNVRAQR
ncbi:hypothetical protein GCM10009827_119150 [Dactylosporangium maewongense]|uniref:Uncharacterized protein n=2 Tax=Dactylosporangium maewongense TaxID=634393 RepID=A0ABN2DHB7_9ACTN